MFVRGVLTTADGVTSRLPTCRGEWSSFYRQFALAIGSGDQRAVPVDPISVLVVMEVLAAVRVSVDEKRRVYIEATCQ